MSARPSGQAPVAWDVIIVGAGPAGSALALRLRPHQRVLLLDRLAEPTPLPPRIGESLPGAARVLLQRLGHWDAFVAQGHVARGASVSAWDSRVPTWFDPIRDPHGAGWHLDRQRFDAGLRAAAVAAGAVWVDHCRQVQIAHQAGAWQVAVTRTTPGHAGPVQQTHCAPVLVDASGRSMVAARQLGLTRREETALICLYLHLPADERDQDQATRVCAERNGWWYSVRVPSGQRVLAFHLDRDDAALQTLRDPEQLLAKARGQALLAEIHTQAAPGLAVQARPATGSVLDMDALAALPAGFFAVGDAMLAFDPIASQGLFNALATAESVAMAVSADAEKRPQAARQRYLDEVRRVHARYAQRREQTYAAVAHHAHERFWQRRAAEAAASALV